MKRKMILPLMVFLFAVAGAFASDSFAQMAWFKVGGVVDEGEIDNTDKPCSLTGSSLCRISGHQAYDSQTNATTGGSAGQLKFVP